MGSLDEARALQSKRDFVRLWHEGSVPQLSGNEACYDGELIRLGVLSPVSAFITNWLFGPGRAWRGKVFDADSGTNLFADGVSSLRRRGFAARVDDSALDGRPCLVLDYADASCGDMVWGRVLGMRDELREVSPGLFFGLGSMRATG